MIWEGVMPAITTCFDAELGIDHEFIATHCRWLLDNGCGGIVALGSLGEGATLSFIEKREVLGTCVQAVGRRAPVISAVSSLSTAEAVALAKMASDCGCDGLMVLPPYVYRGSWREMRSHLAAIFAATSLPCMLYNNPIAYGTDFVPSQIQELAADHDNLKAVKESSADVRRISAIRALVGERLAIFIGVDDAILEAVGAGAIGWVAGLANALPRESVELFEMCRRGDVSRAFELYRWFLPLLRMDTVTEFVQLIKLVQAQVGMGNSRVRPPRLEFVSEELRANLTIIQNALRARPSSPVSISLPRNK